MYAMVVQGGTTPANRDEMNRAVTESLIPALLSEPGFRGAVNLENRATGDGMMLTFWDTEDQAQRPPSSILFREALSAILRISTGERAPMSCWHVNAVQFDAKGQELAGNPAGSI
jgi:heme-degrading monooxygenase HmoA